MPDQLAQESRSDTVLLVDPVRTPRVVFCIRFVAMYVCRLGCRLCCRLLCLYNRLSLTM